MSFKLILLAAWTIVKECWFSICSSWPSSKVTLWTVSQASQCLRMSFGWEPTRYVVSKMGHFFGNVCRVLILHEFRLFINFKKVSGIDPVWKSIIITRATHREPESRFTFSSIYLSIYLSIMSRLGKLPISPCV